MRSLAAVIVLLAANTAHADDKAFSIGSSPAWFVLGGVTTGGTVALADRGAFVGGEVSVVRLRQSNFIGLYADGYYDWGADGTYVTGGLELGHKFVGIDGGVALRMADGETEVGATGRLTVGIGMVGLYVRYAYFDSAADDHVLQVGLALKFPLVARRGR
ncbi:MAG: hypothetical protein ABI867_41370 [Kofleriaceae bacterium]